MKTFLVVYKAFVRWPRKSARNLELINLCSFAGSAWSTASEFASAAAADIFAFVTCGKGTVFTSVCLSVCYLSASCVTQTFVVDGFS